MTASRGDLLRGTLEMLVLQTLTSGPMHGYGITERLQRVSDDVLKIEEGSLYPALYRMQRRGWISSRWGRSSNNRKARFYTVTDKGARHLTKAAASWDRFSEAVAKAMRPV
jgi:PadR family transcriptional regulator PadR